MNIGCDQFEIRAWSPVSIQFLSLINYVFHVKISLNKKASVIYLTTAGPFACFQLRPKLDYKSDKGIWVLNCCKMGLQNGSASGIETFSKSIRFMMKSDDTNFF